MEDILNCTSVAQGIHPTGFEYIQQVASCPAAGGCHFLLLLPGFTDLHGMWNWRIDSLSIDGNMTGNLITATALF